MVGMANKSSGSPTHFLLQVTCRFMSVGRANKCSDESFWAHFQLCRFLRGLEELHLPKLVGKSNCDEIRLWRNQIVKKSNCEKIKLWRSQFVLKKMKMYSLCAVLDFSGRFMWKSPPGEGWVGRGEERVQHGGCRCLQRLWGHGEFPLKVCL